jgi:hypothetical protein
VEPETVRGRPQVHDMKFVFAVAVMLLGSATAFAATPDEAFIAERDAFITKLNPPGKELAAPTDAATKEMEQFRAQLAKRLQALIGPLNVKGFSGEGKYSVDSLFEGDMEFGMLDGLLFTKDKRTRLVVTTVGIAEPWIKRDGFERKNDAPKDLPGALKREEFYTRATPGDAAVSNMGELPITKPAGVDSAYAMLSIRRQDFGVTPVEEMLIGVIVPPRVYILSMPIAKIKIMPACEKLFRDASAKSDRIARSKDEKVAEGAERAMEQGDEAMRKCFAERVKSNPAFPKLTQQAQEFVDMLVAK